MEIEKIEDINLRMRISDTLILSSIYNLRRNSFKELNKFYGVHIRTLKKYLNKFVRKNIL
ncbi:MAG: hypothetical protein ACPLW7_00025 [Minisyncoccia bacterium]